MMDENIKGFLSVITCGDFTKKEIEKLDKCIVNYLNAKNHLYNITKKTSEKVENERKE